MRRAIATLTIAILSALSLSGCIFVRPTQTQPDTVPTNGSVQRCDGVDFTVTGAGYYTLQGACGVVKVTGNNIVIKADSAQAIEIIGDRVSVEMGDIGRLEVSGNDNSVTGKKLGGIIITGDRDIVDAVSVFAVTIQGNDNVVNAKVTGEVVQVGDRNLVGSR